MPLTRPLLNLASTEADSAGQPDAEVTDRLAPLTMALGQAESTWDVLEEIARAGRGVLSPDELGRHLRAPDGPARRRPTRMPPWCGCPTGRAHSTRATPRPATASPSGQAIGMLRERYGLSHEQAFVVLRAISQHADVTVRDLAMRLSETGLPDLPSSRR